MPMCKLTSPYLLIFAGIFSQLPLQANELNKLNELASLTSPYHDNSYAFLSIETNPLGLEKNETYRSALLQMKDKDQQLRKEFQTLVGTKNAQAEIGMNTALREVALKIHANQAENMATLRELIAKYGFPDFTLVGEDGAHAAFLLSQHSTNQSFREEFSQHAENAAQNGNFSKADLAYLIDRNRVLANKPQLYATQRKADGSLYEIEAPEQLQQRRDAMGLPTN